MMMRPPIPNLIAQALLSFFLRRVPPFLSHITPNPMFFAHLYIRFSLLPRDTLPLALGCPRFSGHRPPPLSSLKRNLNENKS